MTTAEPRPGREADSTTGKSDSAAPRVLLPSPRTPESETPESETAGSGTAGSGTTESEAQESTSPKPPARPAAPEPATPLARRLLRHPVTIATAAAAVTHVLSVPLLRQQRR
ncbi:MFS transporter OS=Streptomyces microflavus OX=1919 GN=Smic_32210 PE=4 SV=1 [Streptomyces microflavus]